MQRRRSNHVVLGVAWLLAGLCPAAAIHAGETSRAADKSEDSAARLALQIDNHVEKAWRDDRVVPAPITDDAEFLRRVTLDITGRIPSVSEVRAFLADETHDKRRHVVNRLLESPGYITHFAERWRSVLIPESESDLQLRILVPGFEAWLRDKLTRNTPYDQWVAELLTMKFDQVGGAPRPFMIPQSGKPTPRAFYQAKRAAPEALAAATSRIFLGIRIECAQCHDHPFDQWKREQFWSFAAFFSGLQSVGQQGIFARLREVPGRHELEIPETENTVQATYLGGGEPKWNPDVSPRVTLSDWVTASDNPYFARTAANRMWGHFFGVGIVDPVDDFGSGNPPSHPEILDDIAEAFRTTHYDLKFLIRAITATRTYQRSSTRTDPSQDDPRRFARMSLKALTPRQLTCSLAEATGFHVPYTRQPSYGIAPNGVFGDLPSTFADKGESNINRPTTILQALAMMNGRFVTTATRIPTSRLLDAVLSYPGATTAERIETLYLATLGRMPNEAERDRLRKYVDGGGPRNDPRRALSDVYWALLNSTEFKTNH